jgi:seryl-tRNA synthetase
MEKILSLILDKLDSLDKRLDSMDQRFDAMDQKIDAMDERLTAEQNRHADLLHQLINTVAATNVKIGETNEKLAAIETKVDIITIEVKEIKNTMATKHDLEYYDLKISEHSRQIYKLKNH